MTWDGDRYQARFDELAAEGKDVHGEAVFVLALAPASVLDAGCGTGRVAIELTRRGVDVVGTDVDASMLATARARSAAFPAPRGRSGPSIEWVQADLTTLDLGRTFDVVVMAGNVPLFCAPGTQEAVVAGCARHVAPGGALVCGFQLDGRYELADYDRHCSAAGLERAERWATWDREPFPGDGSYAVSVHSRPAVEGTR